MILFDILLTENELSDKLPTQITVLLRFMALFELWNYRSLEWLKLLNLISPQWLEKSWNYRPQEWLKTQSNHLISPPWLNFLFWNNRSRKVTR